MSQNSTDPKLIEEAGKQVFTDLRSLGMPDEEMDKMSQQIVQDIVDKVLIEVSKALTDEDEQRLKDAAATGLNQMQKVTLVSELFRKKTGKRPEMLVEEFKDEAIIEVIKQYVLSILSGNVVTQISDQNCKVLEKLIDEEKWLDAYKVMSTALKKGTGVARKPSVVTPPQNPSVTTQQEPIQSAEGTVQDSPAQNILSE